MWDSVDLNQMSIFESDRLAGTLSRGEQQRVAIVRALLMNFPVLIADDPTSNLDSETAEMVIDLILEYTQEIQSTVIIASNDDLIKSRADRVEVLQNGTLLTSVTSGNH